MEYFIKLAVISPWLKYAKLPFLFAAKKLHLSPENCLVVEDSLAGVEAAIKGGFLVAAIGDALKSPRLHYKLNAIKDLINIC